MKKKVSPAAIGAFVVGAVVLAVISVLLFGAGRGFFSPQRQLVLFFQESVKGLNIGAPVMFKGVKIGAVTDVRLEFDRNTMVFRIPVIVEIDPQRFREFGGKAAPQAESKAEQYETVRRLVEQKGLKAQLQVQSLVTGQLFVQLDFYPHKPIQLIGADLDIQELPTVASPMEEISEAIEKFPIESILEKAAKALEGIERFVNSPDIRQVVPALNRTIGKTDRVLDSFDHLVADARHLVKNADAQIQPLQTGLHAALESGREAMDQVGRTFALEKGAAGRIAGEAEKTLTAARDALTDLQRTIAGVNSLVTEDSTFQYKLGLALKEFTAAARSLRVLADAIEQRPDVLLRGKTAVELQQAGTGGK